MLLALSACRPFLTDKLAIEPIAQGDVVAVFPPNGAMRLFGDVPIQIVLGAGAAGRVPVVSVTLDGEPTPAGCALVQGGTVADCGVVPDVVPGGDLELTAQIGDQTVDAVAVGRLPEPGLGWSLLDGTAFVRLGGNTDVLAVVNGSLASASSAFLVLDGDQGEPGRYPLVGGPSGDQADGGLALATPGLTFVVTVDVDEAGNLRGEASTAWLALPVDGARVYLLLLGVSITGTVSGDALTNLDLTADLPAMSVQDLANALGPSGPQTLLPLVKYDVDRDGDGAGDAARIELTGDPEPAVLDAWTTSL
jgi:hypothetical protein